jgi:hypothetical protein
MKHQHADQMLAYAQDAQTNEEPWALWEFRWNDDPKDQWMNVLQHPGWRLDAEYRRKVKTIRIGNFDVPEPLRVAPGKKTVYFYPDVISSNLVASYSWLNDEIDNTLLERRVVHLTKEAAKLHAEALLSLSKPV